LMRRDEFIVAAHVPSSRTRLSLPTTDFRKPPP
jgi:hypothetical protein